MMMEYLFVVLGILASSMSQMLLKASSKKEHQSRVSEILNPLVLTSYGVFFCVLLINIWVMSRGLLLKELAILEALGYIFVPMLSWFFFKEAITRATLLAITFIVLGLIMFYL